MSSINNTGSSSGGGSNPTSAIAIGGIAGIPANTPSTIVTYTASGAIGITKISTSGSDYAKFLLYKNTSLMETQRTGPQRNIDFLFGGSLALSSGDIVDVKVIHYNTGVLSDFESTLYGA